MSLSGVGGSGSVNDRPSHLPEEIGNKDWEKTPVLVKKHVSRLNFLEECKKYWKNEEAKLTKKVDESEESLKASQLSVTNLELEVKKLQEGQVVMEATVSELKSKLEGKEEEQRVSEENAAELKVKLEESERNREACEKKISEIQRELEKSQKKCAAFQLKLKSVESALTKIEVDKRDALKKLEEVRKQKAYQAAELQSEITTIKSDLSKMEGVQMELEGVREQLNEEVSKSTKIMKTSKEETEKWKTRAKKYKAVIRSVKVFEFSDDELDKDDDISQAPNIDQPPQTPPPNSSPTQNSANTQPDQCGIQNANNKSAQKTNLNGSTEGLNAQDKFMNSEHETESTTSEGGHSIQDNLSSSSSEDSPPFSPICSNSSVMEGPMGDANSESEESTGLNEDTSNINRSRILPTPEAPLNPSQAGSSTEKRTKRPFMGSKCHKSFKKMKVSATRANNPFLRGPIQQSMNVNFAEELKINCDFCGALFDTNTQLNDHKKAIHLSAWVTPGGEKGTGSTVNNMASPQTTSSAPPGQRSHGLDIQDPSERLCLCGTRFTTNEYLALHLDAQLFGKMYGCIYCDDKYSYLKEMRLHVKNSHTVEKKDESCKVRCGLCLKILSNGNYVRKHCNVSHFKRQ